MKITNCESSVRDATLYVPFCPPPSQSFASSMPSSRRNASDSGTGRQSAMRFRPCPCAARAVADGNISADWLERVGSREHGVHQVGNHLVGHHDGDANSSAAWSGGEELAQVHLPRCSPRPRTRCGTDWTESTEDDAEASLHHPRGDEELGLVCCEPWRRHVVQHRVGPSRSARRWR